MLRSAATFVLVLMLTIAAWAKQPSYTDEKKHYDQQMVRPPLNIRRGAMNRFAKTKDARALKVLRARYAKPRAPKEHEQYQVANAIGAHFRQEAHVQALVSLAAKHSKLQHAWLWHRCYQAVAHAGNLPAIREVASSGKEWIVRRAVATQAMSGKFPKEALALVPGLLSMDTWPKRDFAGTCIASVCAGVFLRAFDESNEEDALAAAEALVALLKRDDVDDTAKLTVARHLTHAYGVEVVTTDHAFWLQRIRFKEAKKGAHTVVARPRFFGLEATGRRVAYLIDMSDSMLAPLKPHEIEDAKVDAIEDPEHPIEWEKIENRFDLARAYLIQALRSLDKDASFLIVGFGKEAETFKTTRGVTKATRGAVKTAIGELRRIRPGKKNRRRPHGTLRGSTNLHGALLRAYRAVPGKLLDAYEHTDARTLIKGCDTIYVLSDGKPTDDDFDAVDSSAGGTVVVDRETGETGQSGGGRANYYGPYQFRGPLLADVDRLNLFRKVEIHTIAIGEADSALLQGLVQRGLGKGRAIGVAGEGGLLNAWWFLGPYPVSPAAAGKAHAPEDKVERRGAVLIENLKRRWRRVFSGRKDGLIPVKATLKGNDRNLAYAVADVHVTMAGQRKLWIGCDDWLKVWVNGKVVYDAAKKNAYKLDQHEIPIELKAGTNRILLKLYNVQGMWRLSARMTDLKGVRLPIRVR